MLFGSTTTTWFGKHLTFGTAEAREMLQGLEATCQKSFVETCTTMIADYRPYFQTPYHVNLLASCAGDARQMPASLQLAKRS